MQYWQGDDYKNQTAIHVASGYSERDLFHAGLCRVEIWRKPHSKLPKPGYGSCMQRDAVQQCSECDGKHTPSLLSKNWKECILYTSCVSAPDLGHRTRHVIWDQLPELPATDSKDACTKLIHWCTKNISEDLASKSHKEF